MLVTAIVPGPVARLFGSEEQPRLETGSVAVVEDLGLPAGLLDPRATVHSLIQRHPVLEAELGALGSSPLADAPAPVPDQVRSAALYSKLLLNVFATGSGEVTAIQLAHWQQDRDRLCAALGDEAGPLASFFAEMEGGLIQRMHLREVLADSRLAATPSPWPTPRP